MQWPAASRNAEGISSQTGTLARRHGQANNIDRIPVHPATAFEESRSTAQEARVILASTV